MKSPKNFFLVLVILYQNLLHFHIYLIGLLIKITKGGSLYILYIHIFMRIPQHKLVQRVNKNI